LCQQQDLTVLDKSECFDYLLASAKGGYAKGLIAVAQLIRAGQGIEANEADFEQLMSSAERQLPSGQAWFE
jgi:hypothetical protein